MAVRFVRDGHRLSRRLCTKDGRLSNKLLGVELRRPMSIDPSHSSYLNCRVVTTKVFLSGLRVTVPNAIYASVTRLHLCPMFVKRTLLRAPPSRNVRFVGEGHILRVLFFLQGELVDFPRVKRSMSMSVIKRVSPIAKLARRFSSFLYDRLQADLPRTDRRTTRSQ